MVKRHATEPRDIRGHVIPTEGTCWVNDALNDQSFVCPNTGSFVNKCDPNIGFLVSSMMRTNFGHTKNTHIA